jgi:hypothetical protein
MNKATLAALIFFSFFCFGSSGKIYTDDTGAYNNIKVEYRGNKLILKDWKTGNTYEFKYYGKGAGRYKGYDWNEGKVLELYLKDDGKGTIDYYDVKRGDFRIDLGKLKTW